MSRIQMTRSQSEVVANRVIHFHNTQANKNSSVTWGHFKKEGLSKTTICRYIKMFGESNSVKFKKNSGRTARVATPAKLRAIKKLYERTPSTSGSVAAKKMKMSRQYLTKVIVHKLGIKARVKKIVPKYVNCQEQRVQDHCMKLFRRMSQKIVVMDDETYVPKTPSEIPGREFVHSLDPSTLTYDQKTKKKKKFFKKYLIWQAMDENGRISQPYIQRGSMNSDLK